jgi:hypothetical protein
MKYIVKNNNNHYTYLIFSCLNVECFEKLWLYTCMKHSKKITVTEYLLHVSVHEIETNEGDNLFTLRQEKIK